MAQQYEGGPFDQLQQENEDLQRALGTIERHLQTALAEKEQVNALYQDFKLHYEQMRSQSNQYQKRLGEEMQAKKELELGLEQRLNDMRRAIEQKQREIDSMTSKMTLPIDTDILRMKIQKDIEARHRIELEQKHNEIERLSDQFYEAKRQLDVVKTQLETQRHESEKEISDLKERGRKESSDLMMENQALQSKADDKRDRELIRQLRRELDEQKRRAQELLSEATELRRDRDALKLDKNEQFVQFTRDMEEERSLKRTLQSDLERSEFRQKCQMEDFQKNQLKLEKKQAELHRAQSEKNASESVLKSREQMIESLQKQTVSLKDEIRVKELEVDSVQKRRQEDEREHDFTQRDERSRYQRDSDKLEKALKELQTQRNLELQNSTSRIESLQRDFAELSSEQKQTQANLSEQRIKNAQMESQYENMQKDLAQSENDLKEALATQRENSVGEGNIASVRKEAEEQLRDAQEEVNKIQQHYENEIGQGRNDRVELVSKVQELVAQNERIKVESNRQLGHYKTKYTEYKTKLRKANQNIATLLARIAKFDIQIAAEREDRQEGQIVGAGGYNLSPDAHHHGGNYGGSIGSGFNLQEMMANDGLNEEIKKLLAETNM